MGHCSCSKGIVSDNHLINQADKCRGGPVELIEQGVPLQETIEVFVSAIKCVNGVTRVEFFYAATQRLALCVEVAGAGSKNPGSSSNRRMRGRGRGGASKAAWNFENGNLPSTNSRRLASVSSARSNALPRTKSVKERWEADAAVSNIRFAALVSRRSSFASRSARAGIWSPSTD